MSVCEMLFRRSELVRGGQIMLLSLMLLACEKTAEWSSVELPVLPEATIELRVASVINPRFPRLSDEQLASVLEKTSAMVKIFFGLSVSFSQPETVPIDRFFNYLDERVKQERRSDIVKFREVTAADRIKMAEGVYHRLTDYWQGREAVADFARPYLLVPYEGDDFRRLASALVDTHLLRLRYWQDLEAEDGKPVIDDTPYNEWVWWDNMGYSEMPYDVVITNQIVASAETYDMSVHSSLRGGLSAGTTTFSKRGQYNGYAYIMVYPMLNDSEMLVTLRNDEHYTSEQVTSYAAALLTHELGHLLLHLGHSFGNQTCVMYPTPLLKYRAWYQGLDASLCALNSESMMKPGAIAIGYRADW